MKNISKIALVIGLIVSLVVLILYFVGGDTTALTSTGAETTAPKNLDLMLYWIYITVAIGVILLIIFAIKTVITMFQTDPKEAMNIANAIAEKGVSELPKLMETPAPHIAEYAIVPVNKSSPSLTKNTMIGALLGLLIMLGLFTIQFLMDDTFKTAEEIEREFGVMPLTVIPEGKIEGMNDSAEKSRKRHRSRYFGRNKKRKRS